MDDRVTWPSGWPVAAADLHAATRRGWIPEVARRNRNIHERECINLNPATNIMNPRAEAALASGLGSRPSLGYAGDRYEMGSSDHRVAHASHGLALCENGVSGVATL